MTCLFKKLIVWMVVILALILIIMKVNTGIEREDFYLMGLSIGDYLEEHRLQFPKDWQEYEDWYLKKNGRNRWDKKFLEDNIYLPWSLHIIDDSYDKKVLTIINPKLKRREESLNEIINRRISALLYSKARIH